MEEEFRTIEKFPDHLIGSLGTIINAKTGNKIGWIKKRGGYVFITFRVGKYKYKSVGAHRLVALAFIGECPDGMEVAHKDGIPGHNFVDNLMYCTPKENSSHKIAHGTLLYCEKHPRAKLTDEDVMEIKQSKITSRPLAAKYGVSPTTIQHIRKGKKWKRLQQISL